MELQTVIGLEVHAQLLTESKMYCGCPAAYADAAPNTHVCPVCLGLPGALPVINRAAVEACVRTGLALDSAIAPFSKLDRKNYGYPDLPKGYQISQYDLPLCVGGHLDFLSEGGQVRAGVTRVHIEEDTGRLVHHVDERGRDVSLVDLNRSGVPLMEIVGDPDLRSPVQARDYLIALRQVLRYTGVSSGNMEEGAFRCDANISVRAADGSFVGPKVEIKNMNSFRSVELALRFEEVRQREAVGRGELLVQETRGWVEARGVTVSQRTKEQAHDYRYFPEPDLPPMAYADDVVSELRASLPELPSARFARYVDKLGLPASDVSALTADAGLADYFEAIDGGTGTVEPKVAANWVLNDVLGAQRAGRTAVGGMPVSPSQLRSLIQAVEAGRLTTRAARELLPQIEPGEEPLEAAGRLQLLSLDDADMIRTAVLAAMETHAAAVADYRRGKTAAIGRLIGESIKQTGGRAGPDQVRAVLLRELEQS